MKARAPYTNSSFLVKAMEIIDALTCLLVSRRDAVAARQETM